MARPSTISGIEAVWSLCKGGKTYATIHRKWGKYLAYLGGDMCHSTSSRNLSECARKVETLFLLGK